MTNQTPAFSPSSSLVVEAPYAERRLDFQFALADGTVKFTATGTNTSAAPSGLRAVVTIEQDQIPNSPQASGHVFGLTLDEMNKLSRAGLLWAAPKSVKNEMTIAAGDALTGMFTVFQGTILEAYPDFAAMPNVGFFFRAQGGVVAQLKPVQPLSYPKTTDVATALGTVAKNMDVALENNGVKTQLGSSYWAGTAWDQAVKIIKAANINGMYDTVNGVLAIWPKTGSRGSDTIEISPETGMINYPQFQAQSVIVRTLFGQRVAALAGGGGKKVSIKSQLAAANGTFGISHITLRLAAQMPGGPWEMVLVCNPLADGQGGG